MFGDRGILRTLCLEEQGELRKKGRSRMTRLRTLLSVKPQARSRLGLSGIQQVGLVVEGWRREAQRAVRFCGQDASTPQSNKQNGLEVTTALARRSFLVDPACPTLILGKFLLSSCSPVVKIWYERG